MEIVCACGEKVIRFKVQALASVDDEEAFGATTSLGMDSTPGVQE